MIYDGDIGRWDVDGDRSSPTMRIEKREKFLMHKNWFRCRDLPAEKQRTPVIDGYLEARYVQGNGTAWY